MKKILVVDDDAPTLLAIETLLNKSNFEVHTDDTGFNVLSLVNTYNPDVIILDIRLPGKNGIEICQDLKKKYSIPVILLSAQADREKALKDSGAEAYVQKPFDLKNFLSLITFYASYKLN